MQPTPARDAQTPPGLTTCSRPAAGRHIQQALAGASARCSKNTRRSSRSRAAQGSRCPASSSGSAGSIGSSSNTSSPAPAIHRSRNARRERLLIDDRPSSHVDQIARRLHQPQARLIDQMPRVGRQCTADRHVVGLAEQLVQPDEIHVRAHARSRPRRADRTPGQRNSNGAARRSTFTTDIPQSHDPQRAPRDALPHVVELFGPAAFASQAVLDEQLVAQRQQKSSRPPPPAGARRRA